MGTIYSDRRRDDEQFRHLDHGIALARTHGWHYAVVYLRNHQVADATIRRVLFGEWQLRRVPANTPTIRQPMAPD